MVNSSAILNYEAREAQVLEPLQSRGLQHENRDSMQLEPAYALWLLPSVLSNISGVRKYSSGSRPKFELRDLLLWVTKLFRFAFYICHSHKTEKMSPFRATILCPKFHTILCTKIANCYFDAVSQYGLIYWSLLKSYS